MKKMTVRERLKNFICEKRNWPYVIMFIALAIVYFIGFSNNRFSYIAIGGLFLFIAVENFIKHIVYFEDIKDIVKSINRPDTHLLNQLGIKSMYTKSRDRDLKTEISSAKEFYSISYVGDTLLGLYEEQFSAAFKNGASVCILVGKKGSDFFKEIDLMQNPLPAKTLLDSDSLVNNAVNRFERIKNTYPDSKGKIEIRSFNTEFRNSVLMWKDYSGSLTALLTVMFGYKRARESMAIEFDDGDGLRDCKAYFDRIWELHKEDVLYDSGN